MFIAIYYNIFETHYQHKRKNLCIFYPIFLKSVLIPYFFILIQNNKFKSLCTQNFLSVYPNHFFLQRKDIIENVRLLKVKTQSLNVKGKVIIKAYNLKI